ncbi:MULTISPECIES: hypothetical protein [unclassified Acinetobacter]|uniref:hypothetical protein n=1 Tax=unclassified Acinetobacter TaxID=196816 RepID=UPI002934343B|nr:MULTISPECIES: hypothetical protein [unclassified Acinetobacter]WOE30357.1 hypothetical protein QSG84_07965 [Acinetobacter sp. SAAs470]WOE38548.1 hypothetical protein QSG86_01630 [Acinetobacter sp. SAAs474]
MINYKALFLAVGTVCIQHLSYAATPPTKYDTEGNNTFVFFENNIDKEYFIAAEKLNPRFTGNNVWTKYGKNKQDSLGYMGTDTGLINNANVDLWLENSAMLYPFQGIRCRTNNAACPSTGFLPAVSVDQYGAYGIKGGSSSANGGIARGSFAMPAYEFLKNQIVGTMVSYDFNYCSTRDSYDAAKGERCKDTPNGRWGKAKLNVTKKADITLLDTNAFTEIWVSTDGTPTLRPNSQYCEDLILGSSDNQQGVACKMLQYNIEGTPSTFSSDLRFYMVVDTALLNNISLAARDIQIDGGNGVWKRFNYTGTDNSMNGMFVTGDGFVRVLFTKAFFKKMLNAQATTGGQRGVFTFAVNNTETPQSGYYQFSSGIDIDIIPREYGISIRHKDLSQDVKSGKIGDNEQDIVFNYIVTQSAPRKADTVTASVIGESTTVKSMRYCLFKSNDNSLNVAIPAYLSYTHETGNIVEQYSGCNASATLDLTHAAWTVEPWDTQQSGYFYSTDLKLRFPMNDRVSQFTIDKGVDWLGSVHAEGDVKVEAKWIGVNR